MARKFEKLVAGLAPQLYHETFIFARLLGCVHAPENTPMTFREGEGMTVILDEAPAIGWN